jgi:myo-inositol-1(or 4)-monophosphatase
MTQDLSEQLDLATRIVTDAAQMVVVARRSQPSFETKSSDTDLVTETDRAVEAFIVQTLAAERPADAVLGEEGTNTPGTSGRRWIIDPIDGTTDFVYGHPGYGVSLALADEDDVLVGVVADIALGHIYRASRGGGAFRDADPLQVRGEVPLHRAIVSTGFSFQADRRQRQAGALAELLPQIGDIRRMGGCAVDLCSVAVGRVDAYFESGVNLWDFAAGGLIAQEAGARVENLRGGPADSEMCVAAPPAIFDELCELLRDLDADGGSN